MPDISNPTVHAHHSNPQKLLPQARLVIFADNHNQSIKIFKCVMQGLRTDFNPSTKTPLSGNSKIF